MILGIGSDLCNIERIQGSVDRFGDRFLNRVFTDTERDKAARRPHTMAGTLAKRFAAKEAFSKAVGTGFKRGVYMKDIGVVNAPSGAPTLQLTGGAIHQTVLDIDRRRVDEGAARETARHPAVVGENEALPDDLSGRSIEGQHAATEDLPRRTAPRRRCGDVESVTENDG